MLTCWFCEESPTTWCRWYKCNTVFKQHFLCIEIQSSPYKKQRTWWKVRWYIWKTKGLTEWGQSGGLRLPWTVNRLATGDSASLLCYRSLGTGARYVSNYHQRQSVCLCNLEARHSHDKSQTPPNGVHPEETHQLLSSSFLSQHSAHSSSGTYCTAAVCLYRSNTKRSRKATHCSMTWKKSLCSFHNIRIFGGERGNLKRVIWCR